jgi:hypothetical protein
LNYAAQLTELTGAIFLCSRGYDIRLFGHRIICVLRVAREERRFGPIHTKHPEIDAEDRVDENDQKGIASSLPSAAFCWFGSILASPDSI